MKIADLIKRLEEFDPEMEVKIKPDGMFTPTEHIVDVRISKNPCPNVCVLIEGK